MGHDVTEYDPQVKEMLERHVPLRLDAQSDWAGAVHRAASERKPDRGRTHAVHGRLGEWIAVRRRSRRVVAAALGIAVLVIGGAATATGIRSWGPSTPSAIDTKEATSLVQYTLTSDQPMWAKGDTIALWRLPQPDGSVCVFTALASPKPTAPGTGGPNPGGGGFCNLSGSILQTGKLIGVEGSYGGGYSPRVSGEVRSGSGIARLEFRWATGSVPLAYDNGWFLGELPVSSELAAEGPYLVVGYDTHGTVVAQRDIGATFGLGSR